MTFDKAHGDEAIAKLQHYLEQVVADRRARPRDNDLMTMVANAEIDGERIPDSVIFGFFRQLMNAAGDTSYNGFSTSMAGLLSQPGAARGGEAQSQPRAQGDRGRAALELAGDDDLAHAQAHARAVRRDDQSGRSHRGRSGRRQSRSGGCSSDPDKFDIHRGHAQSFRLRLGPHICLGQHLARQRNGRGAEPAARPAAEDPRSTTRYPPPEVCGFMLRGPASLHVRFD